MKRPIRKMCVLFLWLFLVQTVAGYAQGALTLSITGSTNPTCETMIQPTTTSHFGNGSLTATASGGTPPYMYSLTLFSAFQNNGYFPGLDMGYYEVTVKDANGVTATQGIQLTNTFPQPTLSLTVLQIPSDCTSFDGSLELMPYGGTPPYTFSTDGGITYHSGGLVSNLDQGYAYAFWMKDANGCIAGTGTGGQNLTSNNFMCFLCCPLEISGVVSKLACTNEGEIQLGVINAAGPIYYSLDGSTYQIGNGANNNASILSNLVPGIYHVYARNSDGSLTGQATFTVDKFCSVFMGLVTADPSCGHKDGKITVTPNFGSGPYQYTMDGVTYQASNVFTGLGPGTYPVTVKDQTTGETESGTATLANLCPDVIAVATAENCGKKDGTITAHATGGTAPYQYSIDGGANYQSNGLFTGLVNGSYIVTMKDAVGVTVTYTIRVPAASCLQVSAIPRSSTCGFANGWISVNTANGTAPYQYSVDGVNFVSYNIIDKLAAGTYNVVVEDAVGLFGFAQVTVVDQPSPVITGIAVPPICGNASGTLTIATTGGTGALEYSVDNGVDWQSSNVFSGILPGQYPVKVEDANGCLATATQVVTAFPAPVVFIGNDTSFCQGDSLTIQAPVEPNYHYQWQDNSVSDHDLAFTAGAYFVKVTNEFNCSVSDTIHITIRPLPVFSLGKDTGICIGRVLKLGPEPPAGNYLWNNGTTNSSITVSAPGQYWLKMTAAGCVYRDTVLVHYSPVPSIDLGPDTSLCKGQSLLLDVTNLNAVYTWQDGSSDPVFRVVSSGDYSVKVDIAGCDTTGHKKVSFVTQPEIQIVKDTTLCVTQRWIIDASYPQATYLWQDGSTQPQYTVTGEGVYTVQVTNACGVSTDSSVVKYNNCACKFYMPSGFTPNNDGKNDVFRPKYMCIFSNYGLSVFGRWGQLIFTSENPDQGWDGTWKGIAQPGGTYVWMIRYKDQLSGKLYEQKGTVVLIR